MVDHLFRHESGRMVAVLSRIFGIHNIGLAEDVVQEAFIKALQLWKYGQIPDNPSAWLMQVAKRGAIDVLRKQMRAVRGAEHLDLAAGPASIDHFFLDHEIADSHLRLMFACCHPALKREDQIALTLKTASGFGIREIAKALLISEDAVKQRLSRARSYLRSRNITLEIPAGESLRSRLYAVLTALYLLFNEGYNSLRSSGLIRKDLCAEAMRLVRILTEHKLGNDPAAFALLSLMCFQSARFDARLDANNQIILLRNQNRLTWDRKLIQLGKHYFKLSVDSGNIKTVYHIEAAIAAQHALATSFDDTNWRLLLKLYDLLMEVKATPVVALNRVVVLLHLGRIEEAQAVISDLSSTQFAARYYLYHAVAAEVAANRGLPDVALDHLQKARSLASTQAEKHLLTLRANELS